MRIAIDMTWMKPGVTGGGESYVRNLLDAFKKFNDDINYILFAAKDNIETLNSYKNNKNFQIVECKTKANNIKQHLIWQSTCEFFKIKKYKPDIIFNPVTDTPIMIVHLKNLSENLLTIVLVSCFQVFLKDLECHQLKQWN